MKTISPKRKKSRRSPTWKRSWRYFYLRIVRLRDRPHFIARGLAVGVFAGCFPIPAMQTLFGVLLAILFQGSKFVAAAGTWISNPFTFAPLYALNFKVGQWVLNRHDLPPIRLNYQSLGDLGDLGADILIIFFTGCFVVGLISSILSYFFGLWFVDRLHQRQRRYRRRAY